MIITINNYDDGSIRMKWFSFGSGDKPFVIIPGLSVKSVMESADAIAQAYDLFAKEYTVYVFDRRENITAPYSIADMAEDTVKVMSSLGLKDITLFGASQGGMISLTIASLYPEMISRLILGSTSAHITSEQYKKFEDWVRLARSGDAVGLYLSFCKDLYPEEVYGQYEAYFRDAASTITAEELERFIILAESMKDFDITNKLSDVKSPVLIIGAFDDAVLDSDMTMEIAEKLEETTDLKLFIYNGYGHAAFDTAPDYKQRIAKWLEEE
ncbi:MAG: alpha/beta hydrolase [Clostridiales bacterium]|nr:alpha/beta hydrolase [Clostridiales bacterium]